MMISSKESSGDSFEFSGQEELEMFLSDAVPANKKGEESYSLEQIIDLHTQTEYSDGLQPVIKVLEEAYGTGLYMKGVSDHVNVGDENKEYKSSFYNSTDVIESGKDSDISVSETFEGRYKEAIKEVVGDREVSSSEDMTGLVLWEDAELDKVREDMQVLREAEGDYSVQELRESGVLNYGMVVFNAAETDFNPDNEGVEVDEKDIEGYVDNIVGFLEDLEEKDAPINHLNQSVHDVYIDGEYRYVKKDEPFENLTIEQKEQVWNTYRQKLMYVAEKLAPKAAKYDVTVSGSHPALPERSSELMEVYKEDREKKAEEEIANFVTHHGIDRKGIEETSNEELHELDRFIDEAVAEEEINKIYPEQALLEFWQPFIETLEDANNYIPEIGGKHVERYPPSILWKQLDEYIPGSDQHRPKESPTRLKLISRLNLPGKSVTPVDKK